MGNSTPFSDVKQAACRAAIQPPKEKNPPRKCGGFGKRPISAWRTGERGGRPSGRIQIL